VPGCRWCGWTGQRVSCHENVTLVRARSALPLQWMCVHRLVELDEDRLLQGDGIAAIERLLMKILSSPPAGCKAL